MTSFPNLGDINWQTALLNSLYCQIEFLKEELRGKNQTITSLLNLVKYDHKQNISAEINDIEKSKFTKETTSLTSLIDLRNEEIIIEQPGDLLREEWNTVKANSPRPKQTKGRNKNNPIPLRNSYSVLRTDDICEESEDLQEEIKIDDRNVTTRGYSRKNKKTTQLKDMPVENLPKYKDHIKTSPGNSTYSDMTKRGKKVCIFGDSLVKRIDMVEFEKLFKKGPAIKRSYPGATASQLKFYVEPTLIEDKPDIAILCIGTNNLSKKNQSALDIVTEIIEIVFKCKESGVNEVFVSGLPCRPAYQSTIDEVNDLLKTNASTYGFMFISSSNIEYTHLYKDKLHLNNEGIILLANNYLGALKQKKILPKVY